MCRISRVGLVGTVLVLVTLLVACQPVQPVAESSATSVETPAMVTATVGVEAGIVLTSAVAANPQMTATEVVTATVAPSAVITSAVATATGEPVIEANPELLAAGLAAYRAQYCGVCHLLAAAETRGTFGPTHNGMGATAALHLADPNYAGTATTPAEYILESIVDPQAFIVPGYATTSHRMPPYAHLEAATLEALVAFLLAQ